MRIVISITKKGTIDSKFVSESKKEDTLIQQISAVSLLKTITPGFVNRKFYISHGGNQQNYIETWESAEAYNEFRTKYAEIINTVDKMLLDFNKSQKNIILSTSTDI